MNYTQQQKLDYALFWAFIWCGIGLWIAGLGFGLVAFMRLIGVGQ